MRVPVVFVGFFALRLFGHVRPPTVIFDHRLRLLLTPGFPPTECEVHTRGQEYEVQLRKGLPVGRVVLADHMKKRQVAGTRQPCREVTHSVLLEVTGKLRPLLDPRST